CDDEDRILYLRLLRQSLNRYGVRLWAYALMTNHVHMIAVPQTGNCLARALGRTHAIYATEFNRKRHLSGHLWQARFYSCVLEGAHLWAAVRYVERNPVRAGIVLRAEDYSWSSAASHVHKQQDPMVHEGLPLAAEIDNWSEWLATEDVENEISAIRQATA